MRWFLIFWAGPIIFLGGWYWLSYYDMNFGIFMLTRQVHDLTFAVYGKALGLPIEKAEQTAEAIKSALAGMQPIPRAGLTDDIASAAPSAKMPARPTPRRGPSSQPMASVVPIVSATCAPPSPNTMRRMDRRRGSENSSPIENIRKTTPNSAR